AGTYTLTIAGPTEDAAMTGDLDITGDLTITGAGAATTIIDGNQLDRVIHSDPLGTGITVTIDGVTIQNGKTTINASFLSDGGGVRNGTTGTGGVNSGGTLMIMNSVITGNSTAHSGGGIGNDGTLVVLDSRITGNTADGNGGGVSQEDEGSTVIA